MEAYDYDCTNNLEYERRERKAQLSKEDTTKDTTSDLISRQAAIDALAKFVPYAICDESTESYTNGLKDAYNLICQLPPAQPEPKEGHWIWVAGELMCSECRTIYSDLYPDYDNAVACPHCGARMKGER